MSVDPGGDWADASYASGGCPGSCKDHVDNNPEAFADAYWDFAGVHVYE